MIQHTICDGGELDAESPIGKRGYSFVSADRMRALLERGGPLTDWDRFSESWNRLEVDTYMSDNGRYRQRRHSVFCADTEGHFVLQPPQAHYQAPEFNPVNGGIERYYQPISQEINSSLCMATILSFCHRCFSQGTQSPKPWRFEVHQFRIEAKIGLVGNPTPEGMHRDGVDFALVFLINRVNIRSGTTLITDLAGHPQGSFTLRTPLDAALVDDRRVFHGVTPVEAVDETKPAYRDVLVVTIQNCGTTSGSGMK